MKYGLTGEQPETLLQIWEFTRRWGRIPTARELAQTLGVDRPQTAYMRMRRLQQDDYLVKGADRKWAIDTAALVTEPETAALLIRAQEESAHSRRGKLTQEELLALALEVGISLSKDQIRALVDRVVSSEYLVEPPGYPLHYQIGPRFHTEYRWLVLLSGYHPVGIAKTTPLARASRRAARKKKRPSHERRS